MPVGLRHASAVDEQRDLGILPDVSEPFQLRRSDSLGLLVDGRIKTLAVEDIADWDDVRPAVFICGGEMGDASGTNEARGVGREA